MGRIISQSAVLAVTTALAFGAFAQDATTDLDQSIATVNGTTITLGEVLAVKEQLPEQFLQGEPNEVLKNIVDQIAVQKLVEAEVSESRALELRKAAATRTVVVNQVIDEYVDEQLTDEYIQARYDELIGGAPDTDEWNASHILVDSEEAALGAVERINGGEDFAEVAKELSSDGSAANGGELGWFGAGRMVPEFQTAVEALEVGAVSAPVQSQFGFHVIKLNEKRVAEKPTIDDVRDQLVQFSQQQLIDGYITPLQEAAEIVITEGVDPLLVIDGSL